MSSKNNIIAILTGKGGSALKDKNIKVINKLPLLGYPCKEAKKVKKIKKFYVSSEDNKILKAASKYGFKKIKRPKSLSKQNSLHRDVLIHALNSLEERNIRPKIIIVLLANSATIKSEWISRSIKKLLSNPKATACVPIVTDNDHHPYRAKRLSKAGYLKSFFKIRNISSNRQDLEKNYFLCHNFWTIKTNSIYDNNGEAPWKFMGKNVLPIFVDYSLDVHDDNDILLTKEWIRKQLKN